MLKYTKILAEESKEIHRNDDHQFNIKDIVRSDFSTIQILAWHINGVMNHPNQAFNHYKN